MTDSWVAYLPAIATALMVLFIAAYHYFGWTFMDEKKEDAPK